jgi:hypothetical protein
MGRVSSRYNYRISKSKKDPQKKSNRKVLSPDQIIIRNKKTKPKKVKKILEIKTVVDPKRHRNNIIKKAVNSKNLQGGASLNDIKDYCYDKKVILVGNASDIIKNPYGSQIDSYDIVIRMNHGHPILKFASQMGSKYNIWAHGFLSYKKQISEYGRIKEKIDFHIETNEKKLCKKIFDKKAFLIPNKWYKKEYETRHAGKEMSTGLNAASFFVNWVGTMREISIVGFDFLKTSNPTLQSAPARKFHDTNIERATMISLLIESEKYLPFNEKYNFAK